MYDLLFSLWLFLPAGVANMIPTIVWRLPGLRRWNTPIDFGMKVRGIRALGANKTWRGVVCGTIAGVVVFYLQQQVAGNLGEFSDYLEDAQYTSLSLWFGLLLGLGALLGDATESFIKRQKNIAAGTSWFPFDQLDYIIGACLLTAPLYVPEPHIYLMIFIFWFVLHLLFSAIGYLLKFKKALI